MLAALFKCKLVRGGAETGTVLPDVGHLLRTQAAFHDAT